MTVFEDQWALLEQMPPEVAEWGWQDEVAPDTGRKHKQGYLRTKSQVRFSQLKKILPGIHIEVAKNWAALVNYCKKEDTRDINGQSHHEVNSIPSKYTYAKEVAERLAETPIEILRTWDVSHMLEKVKDMALSDIMSGREGIEWIIIDPNWKLMWKETGMATIIRVTKKTDRQTDKCVESTLELISPAEV